MHNPAAENSVKRPDHSRGQKDQVSRVKFEPQQKRERTVRQLSRHSDETQDRTCQLSPGDRFLDNQPGDQGRNQR